MPLSAKARFKLQTTIRQVIVQRQRRGWENEARRLVMNTPWLISRWPGLHHYNDLAAKTRIKIISADDAQFDLTKRIAYGDYWARYEITKVLGKAGYFVTDQTPDVVLHLWGGPATLPKRAYKIAWLYDHPQLVTPRILRQYDRIYCLSAQFTEKIRRMGFPAEWLPGATSMTPVTRELLYDVVFVGNGWHKGGRPIVTNLGLPSYNLKVWGRGWGRFLPAEFIGGMYYDYPQLALLYGAARIALNDNMPDMRREGFAGFRIYDILGSGGFCISDSNTGIYEIFGESVPQVSTPEALRNSVQHYLDHPDERCELSAKGHALVGQYRWEQVVARLLEDITPRMA
ncbi:MAG: glycosyltransferase [Anaerolineales bacterium]|nr:glycosyltransferase [Anaerolineales bacterium]